MPQFLCNNCGWSGSSHELVALTDDLDDNDINYCPHCGSGDLDVEDPPYDVGDTRR